MDNFFLPYLINAIERRNTQDFLVSLGLMVHHNQLMSAIVKKYDWDYVKTDRIFSGKISYSWEVISKIVRELGYQFVITQDGNKQVI